jgi:hypothetical protein
MKTHCLLQRSFVLSICAAVTFFGVAADNPFRTLPVRGTLGTSLEMVPTDTPGVVRNIIQGVGDLPKLGICTVAIQETVDFRTNPPQGTQQWLLTFAGGDQLFATLAGAGEFDETNPAFVLGVLEGKVTGGTGRLQDAAGTLKASFVAHINTAPGVVPATGHATIQVKGYVHARKD